MSLPIESLHTPFYLMAIVKVPPPLSVIISEIFAIKMYMALPPWSLEWVQNKCKYAKQKAVYDFLSDDSCSVYSICCHIRDIHSQKVPDIALDI